MISGCALNTIGTGAFASLLDRITKLDAEMAERELHLEKGAEGGWSKAALRAARSQACACARCAADK